MTFDFDGFHRTNATARHNVANILRKVKDDMFLERYHKFLLYSEMNSCHVSPSFLPLAGTDLRAQVYYQCDHHTSNMALTQAKRSSTLLFSS